MCFFLIFELISAQTTYLLCGEVFDAKKGKFVGPHTIVVEGDRIKSVEKGYQQPENVNSNVIDLKSKTVYPGFIDMHVHIEGEYSPDLYLKVFQHNPEDTAFEAAEIANRTLMAGFTTVRDMGGTGVNIALRNAVNKGLIPGQEFLQRARPLEQRVVMQILPTALKIPLKEIQDQKRVL